MCTQSTSGASVANSEVNSTGRLSISIVDDFKHGDVLDSTVRIDRGTRVSIEGMRAIFSPGWLYLYNGITSAMKFDQPHLSENIARSLKGIRWIHS